MIMQMLMRNSKAAPVTATDPTLQPVFLEDEKTVRGIGKLGGEIGLGRAIETAVEMALNFPDFKGEFQPHAWVLVVTP